MDKQSRNVTLGALLAGGLLFGTCVLTSKPTTVLPDTHADLTPFVVHTYFQPEPVRYLLEHDKVGTIVLVGSDFLISHKRFIDRGSDGTLDEVATWLPIRAVAGYYDENLSQRHQELYDRILKHAGER